MNQPLVSVKMITYNHAPYIAQAIESVLMQKTDFPFELVIGEDCSTDETRRIVFDYAERYPETIRVITSDANVGMHQNSHRTAKACQGKYIAYCEGDDYWHHPDKLQKQVDYLEQHPEYGLVCSDYDLVDTRTNTIIEAYGRASGKTGLHEPQIVDIVSGNACVQTLTVVARRELVATVEEADPFLHSSGHFMMGDTQLWAEISLISKIHFMAHSLAVHQIIEESATRSREKWKELSFRLNGAEMCLYLCRKHKLPEYVKKIHEKNRRRISLRLAFVMNKPDLAVTVRKECDHLTGKEWLLYQGGTNRFMRPVVLLLQYLFQRSRTKYLRARNQKSASLQRNRSSPAQSCPLVQPGEWAIERTKSTSHSGDAPQIPV